MIKRFLITLCAVLVSGGALLAASPAPRTLFFEAKLKSQSSGSMGTRKMWIKGNRLRWEFDSGQLQVSVVKNDKGVFLIHPWRNEAAKYPPGSNRENPGTYLPGPTCSTKEFLAEVKAKKCGREKLGKESCDIYTYSHPIAKRVCKLWVSAKSGKPVKLLLEDQNRKQDSVTAFYTRFEPGAVVSDSRFELPKGCKVRMMPTRPKPEKAAEKQNSTKAG